jgi:hypothetical protein
MCASVLGRIACARAARIAGDLPQSVLAFNLTGRRVAAVLPMLNSAANTGEGGMLRIGMGILAAAILSGDPALAQKARDTGPGGVSCTYEKCIDNCVKLGGKLCPNYCEKTLKQRRMSGVCKP